MLVAQTARAKYGIDVTAVYWRASEHVAVGDPQQRVPAVSQPAPLHPELAQRRTHSRPAPLEAAPPRPEPAPRTSRPAPLEARTSRPTPLEPLQPDEVNAFRNALDAGLRGERALAAAGRTPPHNYTLLTGFEDTEMAPDADGGQELSGTQYGALR